MQTAVSAQGGWGISHGQVSSCPAAEPHTASIPQGGVGRPPGRTAGARVSGKDVEQHADGGEKTYHLRMSRMMSIQNCEAMRDQKRIQGGAGTPVVFTVSSSTVGVLVEDATTICAVTPLRNRMTTTGLARGEQGLAHRVLQQEQGQAADPKATNQERSMRLYSA